MKGVINLDLDWFNQPYYTGSGWVEKEWKSWSDFQAKAKTWITIEEFLEKTHIPERIRGNSGSQDHQTLYSFNKIKDEGWIDEETTLYYFDAHHDCFSYFPKEYYSSHSYSHFKPYEALAAIHYYGVFQDIIWIVPDYFTDEDLNRQISWREDGIKREGHKIIFDFFKKEPLVLETKKIGEIDFSSIEWKYMNIVMNEHLAKVPQSYFDELNKRISRW